MIRFVHVGKTGGSAVKAALKQNGYAYFRKGDPERATPTAYGRVMLPRAHGVTVADVPPGDHTFFFVRDPISRFVSGFYSRLRKGQPRYNVEWKPDERVAFEAFPTPLKLARALVSDDPSERQSAEAAMEAILHLRPMGRWTGTPDELRERGDQILYVGKQETLGADWENLKRILELPRQLELPTDPVTAHRRDQAGEEPLDEEAVEVLRDWYRRDYELVEYCDQLRAERGWSPAGERSSA